MAKKMRFHPSDGYPDDDGYRLDDFDDMDPMVAASLAQFRRNVHELLTSQPRVTPDELAASGLDLLRHFDLAQDAMYNGQVRDILGEVMKLEQMVSDKNPDEAYVHSVSHGLIAHLDYTCLNKIRENWNDDLFLIVDGLAEEAMGDVDYLKDALRIKAYINGYDSVAQYYAAEKDKQDGPIHQHGVDQVPWCLMENMPDIDSNDPSFEGADIDAAMDDYGQTYLRDCLNLPDHFVDDLLKSIDERMREDEGPAAGRLIGNRWRLYLQSVGSVVQYYGVDGVLKLWESDAGIVDIGSYTPEQLRATYALVMGNEEYLAQVRHLPTILVTKTAYTDHNGALERQAQAYDNPAGSVTFYKEIGKTSGGMDELSDFAALLAERDIHPEVFVLSTHGFIGGMGYDESELVTDGDVGLASSHYDQATLRADDSRDLEAVTSDEEDGIEKTRITEATGLFRIVQQMRPDVTGAYSIVAESCLQGAKNKWQVSTLEEIADICREYLPQPGTLHVYGAEQSFSEEHDDAGNLFFVNKDVTVRGRKRREDISVVDVMHVFYDDSGVLHTIRQDTLSLPALHRPKTMTEEDWHG